MDRLRAIQYTLEDTLATYRENGWLDAAKDVEDAIKLLRAVQARDNYLGAAIKHLESAEGILRVEGYDTRDISDALAALEEV